MLRCVLIAVLLGGVCLTVRAETVRFYLPSLPGIYEERDGKPAGLYADLLQHMAGHAGVSLSMFIASRPRIQQSMQLQDDACSAVTLPANVPAPAGMQYVFPMGQTQAQLFTRPGDALALSELATVTLTQQMVFGEGVASVLQQRGLPVPARSQSLQEAVAMLQGQRIRVLQRLAPGAAAPFLGPDKLPAAALSGWRRAPPSAAPTSVLENVPPPRHRKKWCEQALVGQRNHYPFVARALAFDLLHQHLADFTGLAHVCAATGLQVDTVDDDQADLGQVQRRRHRHGLDQLGLRAQGLAAGHLHRYRMVGRNQRVQFAFDVVAVQLHAFRQVEIQPAAIGGEVAAGDAGADHARQQVQAGVYAHVAMAARPVKLQRHGATGGQLRAAGGQLVHDLAAGLVAAGVGDGQLAAIGQLQRGRITRLAATQRVAQRVGQHQAALIVAEDGGVQRGLVRVEVETFRHGGLSAVGGGSVCL